MHGSTLLKTGLQWMDTSCLTSEAVFLNVVSILEVFACDKEHGGHIFHFYTCRDPVRIKSTRKKSDCREFNEETIYQDTGIGYGILELLVAEAGYHL